MYIRTTECSETIVKPLGWIRWCWFVNRDEQSEKEKDRNPLWRAPLELTTRKMMRTHTHTPLGIRGRKLRRKSRKTWPSGIRRKTCFPLQFCKMEFSTIFIKWTLTLKNLVFLTIHWPTVTTEFVTYVRFRRSLHKCEAMPFTAV